MIPMGTCPRCGTPHGPGVMSCGHCGAPIAPAVTPAVAAAATPPVTASPPPASGSSKRWSTGQVVALLIGVLALVGGGVFLGTRLADRGEDDGTDAATTAAGPTSSFPAGVLDPSTLAPGEVLLEPVNSQLAEPFMPTVATGREAAPTVSLPPIPLPTTTAPAQGGQVVLPTVAGREPGLYGGTRDAKACDPQAMITFLEQHPDKAAAWASVQGIAVGEIRWFIEGLTPVVLTRDTRVTNHGFRNGQAFAHPSVLQAGHAVLVDEWGVPRAKCSCGNPLTPPEPLMVPPIYVGPQWPGFDVTIIIVVVATEPVDDDGFVIVDVSSGDLIIRPIGADPGSSDLGTGDVRVTLRWSTVADLDLSVTDPTGETVSYGTREVSSGGVLDVDANASCGNATAAPAENIIWPDTAPDGRYVVTVNLYNPCETGEVQSFELTAYIGGVPVQLFLGTDDGGLSPSDGAGTVSSATPTVVFAFDNGDVIDNPEPNVTIDPDDAVRGGSYQILDQLLLDCGYGATFTDLGPIDNGWWWSVTTTGGEAEFLVYDPLGDWAVVPNNDPAATLGQACGFYSP